MFNKAMMLANNAESLIEFSIENWAGGESGTGVPYKARAGMTWEEFLNSSYYYVPNGGVEQITVSYGWVNVNGVSIKTNDANNHQVLATDELIPDSASAAYYVMCYVKGTLISLADGSTKRVEDITYEDTLLVWDFDNGRFTEAKPLWIQVCQTATYFYRLKFEDGTEIGLVGQDGKCHRLFNVEKQEFISGTDFHVGEHTFNAEGKQVKLISIEIVEQEVEFYNIVTDFYMNCFANGLLTSTQYNNVYPIKDMKFVKDGRELVPFEAYEGIPKEFYDGMRLGEQDLNIRSVEKTNAYIGRMLGLMK